jgi:hypothetical protein
MVLILEYKVKSLSFYFLLKFLRKMLKNKERNITHKSTAFKTII